MADLPKPSGTRHAHVNKSVGVVCRLLESQSSAANVQAFWLLAHYHNITKLTAFDAGAAAAAAAVDHMAQITIWSLHTRQQTYFAPLFPPQVQQHEAN